MTFVLILSNGALHFSPNFLKIFTDKYSAKMFARNKISSHKGSSHDGKIQYALKILTSLDKLRAWEYICDFTIKSGSETFPVHRTVLAVASKYFHNIFLKNTQEACEGTITIDGIQPNIVRQCIEFMYSGEAKITSDNVDQLLDAADKLQLPDLGELCLNSVVKNLTVDNCLYMKKMCSIHGCKSIESDVEKFIANKFEHVIDTEEFGKLNKQGLSQYLDCNDIDPELLWEGLIKWIKFERWIRKQHFSNLMIKVLGKCSPKFIINTVSEEQLVEDSKQCKNYVVSQLFSKIDELKESIDVDNCYFIRELCHAHHEMDRDGKVEREVNLFFLRNFEKISQNPEFSKLSKDEVFLLFRSPKAKYTDERCKFEAAVNWVEQDRNHRRGNFYELFKMIKLENLPSEYLNDVVRRHTLVDDSGPCKDLITDAFYAHVNNGPSPSKKIRLQKANDELNRSKTEKTPKKTPKSKAKPSCEIPSRNPVNENKFLAVLHRNSGEVRGFSLEDSEWRSITKTKNTLDNFYTIVSVEQHLYLLSGSSLFSFQTDKTWKKLVSLKSKPPADAKALEFQKRLYILSGSSMSFYSFALDQWEENLPSFVCTYQFCAVATDSNIFAIGGNMTASMATRYNPQGESWSIIAPMENYREGSSATAMNGMVYVLGGSHHTPSKTVSMYNPMENAWTDIAPMQYPRMKFSACSHDGKLYAVGGTQCSADSIEVYDKNKKNEHRWRVLHPMLKLNHPYSACLITI